MVETLRSCYCREQALFKYNRPKDDSYTKEKSRIFVVVGVGVFVIMVVGIGVG